jgi:hypothetical protein
MRLAKQIGIADVAIAKHCRKLGVPIRERGYWNTLTAAKRVPRWGFAEADKLDPLVSGAAGRMSLDSMR